MGWGLWGGANFGSTKLEFVPPTDGSLALEERASERTVSACSQMEGSAERKWMRDERGGGAMTNGIRQSVLGLGSRVGPFVPSRDVVVIVEALVTINVGSRRVVVLQEGLGGQLAEKRSKKDQEDERGHNRCSFRAK